MKLSEFKPTEEVLERADKCATAEELVSLAQEYDVELSLTEATELLSEAEESTTGKKTEELKELNDAELDMVSGGDVDPNQLYPYLPDDAGRFIGRYDSENYKFEKVYVVDVYNPQNYIWGDLDGTYELCNTWVRFKTTRRYDIYVRGVHPQGLQTIAEVHPVIGTRCYEFNGDQVALFLKKPPVTPPEDPGIVW